MKKYVIIVAGGSGTRMGNEIPKQFLLVNNLPVLMHTINCFLEYDLNIKIIMALPESQIVFWNELCNTYNFSKQMQIVKGGKERFESVKNALSVITGDGLVAIHDGVRPLVSVETIKLCFETAQNYGNAVPVFALNESVRKIDNEISYAVNRSEFRIVQTPQVFQIKLIQQAYMQQYCKDFTDDASVLERKGIKINLVEGNRENIKITTPVDLIIAEALLRKK
jgi:2-C-methyl-D-erythritol 4-phosphate cytidylyltransferase